MSSFFRFIVILIVAASLINLTIVIAANHVGQTNQRKRVAAELTRMERHYTHLTTPTESRISDAPLGLEADAHLYVMSQEIGPDNKAISTTCYLRFYRIDPEGKHFHMPARRLVIPGDYFYFNAIAINFTNDLPDFKFLRGRTLCLLSDISTNTTGPAAVRFFSDTKIIDPTIPETVLPNDRFPSQQEYQLWRMVGDAFNASLDRREQPTTAPASTDAGKGIEFSTPIPEKRQMTRGRLYRLVVTPKSVILAMEDRPEIVESMNAEINPKK